MEKISKISSLLLIGIPTRGVYLSKLLAKYLEELSNQPVENGSLDPAFHRDDLASVGTRTSQATDLSLSIDAREIVLIDDDFMCTGRTSKAALEALNSLGRAKRVTILTMV